MERHEKWKMNGIITRRHWLHLACGVSVTLGAGCPQPDPEPEPEPEAFTINLKHTGVINGDEFVATGTGTADPKTGIVLVDWVLDEAVRDYHHLCSIVTLAGTGGGSTVGLAEEGAVNLLDLAGGNYTVTVESPGITTTMQVVTDGNVIDVSYETNGNFVCNDIKSMRASTVEWVADDQAPNRFTERMFMLLETEEGDVLEGIVKELTYQLPEGIDFPGPQEKDMVVTVLEESADGRRITVQYEVTIRPAATLNRCRYQVVNTTPIGGCQQCPCVQNDFFCAVSCPIGNECAAFQSNVTCSGGGKCLVEWSVVACQTPCTSTCP